MQHPLHFKGVVHPPGTAASERQRAPDLSAAEIESSNLGANGRGKRTLPLFVEHDTNVPRSGDVLSSYRGADGEMRVAGVVRDPQVAAMVQSGELSGLSLSTHLRYHAKPDGTPDTNRPLLGRVVKECSLCEIPGRPGCFVTEIDADGKGYKSLATNVAAYSGTSPYGSGRTTALTARALAYSSRRSHPPPPANRCAPSCLRLHVRSPAA